MAAIHLMPPQGLDPPVDDLNEFVDFTDLLSQDFFNLEYDMTQLPAIDGASTATTDFFFESAVQGAPIEGRNRVPLADTSPGRQIYRTTAAGSSVSPGTLILTPSTNPNDSDVPLFEDQDSSDAFSASPHSNVSPIDALFVQRFGNRRAPYSRTMNEGRRPVPSGTTDGTQTSRPVHQPSTSFANLNVPTTSNMQWSSFPQDPYTSDHQNDQTTYFNAPASFAYGSQQQHGNEDILAGIASQYNTLPIRTFPDGSVAAEDPNQFISTTPAQQQQRQTPFGFQNLNQTSFPPEHFYTQAVTSDGAFMTGPASNRSQSLFGPTFSWLPTQPAQGGIQFPQQHVGSSSAATDIPPNHINPSNIQVDRTVSLPSLYGPVSTPAVQQSIPDSRPRIKDDKYSRFLARAHSREQSGVVVKSESSQSTIGPVRSHPHHRRGGRAKGMNLDDKTRHDINEMRKVGACWVCRLQRDQCDHGDPCNRCLMKAQRGQVLYFPCDRSTLPVLIHDFLPPSMTAMHQKQSIEDLVVREVRQWDENNCMQFTLSCGYGPALIWNLYEFMPATKELLWQLQYVRNPDSGVEEQLYKWSPPFAMLKLNTSDADRFEEYMETLLQAEYLRKFGQDFYSEETQVDPEDFQGGLLFDMCALYLNSQDNKLRALLRELLKLLIVTYIAAHTLTIQADTLPSIIAAVRHTETPANAATGKHTSPRLANRQFKFFFGVIRNNMFDAMLKQYQAILRQNYKGVKEETWLMCFCVVLTFAMALEEVQRTLFIQARAQIYKKECSESDALRQAENACRRIDERFELLIGLFLCKYRDRNWRQDGSFGPSTPVLEDGAATVFLSAVRMRVEARRDHLEARKGVQFALENETLYTTRLTARFLLPFLSFS